MTHRLRTSTLNKVIVFITSSHFPQVFIFIRTLSWSSIIHKMTKENGLYDSLVSCCIWCYLYFILLSVLNFFAHISSETVSPALLSSYNGHLLYFEFLITQRTACVYMWVHACVYCAYVRKCYGNRAIICSFKTITNCWIVCVIPVWGFSNQLCFSFLIRHKSFLHRTLKSNFLMQFPES